MGVNHDAAVDHRQIFAFEQHEAEIAGDIGVFIVGFVCRAGGQNADAVVAGMFHRLQRIAEGAEEGGETVNRGFGIKNIGEGARGGNAAFKREACT